MAKIEQVLLIGAGVIGAAALGYGLYLALRKGPGIHQGDTITISNLSFEYMGPEDDLSFCWGLKKGTGDFNNGDNLVGGNSYFGVGGPIHVTPTVDWKKYTLDPRKLQVKPELFLDPDLVDIRVYDTYIWLSTEPTADKALILIIDTDADAVKVEKPAGLLGARNLGEAYHGA